MSGVLWESPTATTLAGFKVQTAVYGLPVPIIYGTSRVAGNLIHMPNPPVLVRNQSKGIVSKGAQSPAQNYNAAIIIGLCEGPIVGIGDVWRDKDAKAAWADYSAAGFGLVLGNSSQTPWGSLPSAQQLGYREVAYIDHPTWPLPNNSMASYSWEVQGFEIFGGGIEDASPADIIYDYLTSAQYGAGFSATRIGSITTFQNYCAAFGLFCSPTFVSQQAAREQLNELLEISNTGAVWSDGVLKFKPFGDTAKTANGHTYTPNTTPVYDLTDNDYLSRGKDVDPIIVHRKSPVECFNQVTVEYDDREFDYNGASQKAEEQDNLLLYGPRPMPPMQLRAIKTAAVAQSVAQIRLQREQNVRNTYAFKLGWRFILLEPMDLVTLTDTNLGLSLTPVRITQIVELDNEEGIEVTAEDWPFGTASATQYRTASNEGTAPDTNVDPGDTNPPTIFDMARQQLSAPYQLGIGASGGANWGGCDVYISSDNTNFKKVGTMVGNSIHGFVNAACGTDSRYPNVDTTNNLYVALWADDGFIGLTNDQFDQLAYPMLAGNEWMAYRDLTHDGSLQYHMNHLYRGVYGTTISTHDAFDRFVLLDDRVGRFAWPGAQIGQTLYIKLPAFNIFGGALQDLADISSTSFVVGLNPVPPFNPGAQGTVSIDANGSWSATADGPGNAMSFRYLTSTSSYPSDASVESTGTIVNGRTFSVTAGGTLSFGQTVYITIVPYTYPDADGLPQSSIHLRGSYQSYTATKTSSFAASNWSPANLNYFNVPPDYQQYNYISDGTITSDAFPSSSSWKFRCYVAQAPGCTLTNVSVDANAGTGTGNYVEASIWYQDSNGIGHRLGYLATTPEAGWQTLSMNVSDSTSARKYYVEAVFEMDSGTPDADIGGFTFTWSMPDPKQTL